MACLLRHFWTIQTSSLSVWCRSRILQPIVQKLCWSNSQKNPFWAFARTIPFWFLFSWSPEAVAQIDYLIFHILWAPNLLSFYWHHLYLDDVAQWALRCGGRKLIRRCRGFSFYNNQLQCSSSQIDKLCHSWVLLHSRSVTHRLFLGYWHNPKGTDRVRVLLVSPFGHKQQLHWITMR